MLRLNLSTRPFYNERLVKVTIAVIVLLTAALTMFNVAQILSLTGRNRELTAQAAASEAKANELRAQAQQVRQAMNRAEVSEVQAEAREANILIDRRVFSWTDLFNRFEETLPAEARILAVSPQVDTQGRMLVAMTVVARRPEDRDLFVDRLEETGAFSKVMARNDEVLEDGTMRSILQGYYMQTPRPPAAVSSPPASESHEASSNASPANATPAMPSNRSPR